MSEKFEYFAIRNAAGLFDTSPLYKYRFNGPDAERFLAGVLARDTRKLAVGRAQYTLWCDDRGFVIEDGVLLRVAEHEYLLTAAEPNLAYFQGLAGSLDVAIEDVSDGLGHPLHPGPPVARPSRRRCARDRRSRLLRGHPHQARGRRRDRLADRVHRRPRVRGLGPAADALEVWDAVWKVGEPRRR